MTRIYADKKMNIGDCTDGFYLFITFGISFLDYILTG